MGHFVTVFLEAITATRYAAFGMMAGYSASKHIGRLSITNDETNLGSDPDFLHMVSDTEPRYDACLLYFFKPCKNTRESQVIGFGRVTLVFAVDEEVSAEDLLSRSGMNPAGLQLRGL